MYKINKYLKSVFTLNEISSVVSIIQILFI